MGRYNVEFEVASGEGNDAAVAVSGWVVETLENDIVRARVEARDDLHVLDLLNERWPHPRGWCRVWRGDAWGSVYLEDHPQTALEGDPWIWVDAGIAGVIEGLNENDIVTLFSCQGYDTEPAYVMLAQRDDDRRARNLMGVWAEQAGVDTEVVSFLLDDHDQHFSVELSCMEKDSSIEETDRGWRVRHWFEPQIGYGKRSVIRVPSRCVPSRCVDDIEDTGIEDTGIEDAAIENIEVGSEGVRDERSVLETDGATGEVAGLDSYTTWDGASAERMREELEKRGFHGCVREDESHVSVRLDTLEGYELVWEALRAACGETGSAVADGFLRGCGAFWEPLGLPVRVSCVLSGSWRDGAGDEVVYTACESMSGEESLLILMPRNACDIG